MPSIVDLINSQLRLTETINTSAGVGSAGRVPKLNGSGLIDTTMLPPAAFTHVFVSTSSQLDNAMVALRAIGGGTITMLNDITFTPAANRDITNIRIVGGTASGSPAMNKLTFGNANYCYGTYFELDTIGIDPFAGSGSFRITDAVGGNFIKLNRVQHRGTPTDNILDLASLVAYIWCDEVVSCNIANANSGLTTVYLFNQSGVKFNTTLCDNVIMDSSSGYTGAVTTTTYVDNSSKVLSTPLGTFTSTNVQAYINEVIGAKQKDMETVVLGDTTNGDVKGVNCDYVETDMATTTFSNVRLVIKEGNYVTETLQLNNTVHIEQDENAALGTVLLNNGTRLIGNLNCSILNVTAGDDAYIYNGRIQIATSVNDAASLTFNHCIIENGLTNVNITDLIFYECDIDNGNINEAINITLINTRLENDISSAILNDVTIYNSQVGNIANAANSVVITNSYINGIIGDVGNNLTISNSNVISTIGNVTSNVIINESEIASIGNIGGTFVLSNSQVSTPAGIGTITGIANIYTSFITQDIQGISNGFIYNSKFDQIPNVNGTLVVQNSSFQDIGSTTNNDIALYNCNYRSVLNAINTYIYNSHCLSSGNVDTQNGYFYNSDLNNVYYNAIGGIYEIVNCYINNLGVLANPIISANIKNSYIQNLYVNDPSSTDIYNSYIEVLSNPLGNPVYLTSKDSYIGFNDPALRLALTNGSDITINASNLNSIPQALTFGDGSGASYTDSHIKILCSDATNQLTINDDPGDTFDYNIITVEYARQLTLNLVGNPTNRIQVIGDKTGLTETSNTYQWLNIHDFGEMYQYNNGIATVIGVASTWYQVANFSAGSLGYGSSGVVFAGNQLQVKRSGLYKIDWTCSSISAGVNQDMEYAIAVNGTVDNKTVTRRRHASTDTGSCAGNGIIQLNVNDLIDFRVQNLTSGTNATIVHANVNLTQIDN